MSEVLCNVLNSKSNLRVITIGSSSGNYDVSSYPGYKNFTVDNFVLDFNCTVSAHYNDVGGVPSGGDTDVSGSCGISKSYNPSTGIFSVSNGSGSFITWNGGASGTITSVINSVKLIYQ